MKSVWRALIWKEWHEHKWKLVALTAVLMLTLLLTSLRANSTSDVLGIIYVILLGYAFFAPIFVAADNGSIESARRTLAFLQSQPVPMWRLGFLKLVFGLVAVLVPILLVFGTLLAIHSLSPEWKDLFDRSLASISKEWSMFSPFAVTALVAGSIYLWAAAIGVNCHSLISGAARILASFLGLWCVAWFILSMFTVGNPRVEVLALFLPGGPYVLMTAGMKLEAMRIVALIEIAIYGTLALFFVGRFGRSASDTVSPRDAGGDVPSLWLLPPRSTGMTALVWKQFRESIPIVATALAASLGISVIVAVNLRAEMSESFFVGVMMGPAAYLAFFAAVVVGVGLFSSDLTPTNHTFWRSRPIDPDRFFWVKLLTGVFVLYGAFSIPAVIVIAASGFFTGFLHMTVLPEEFWYFAPLPLLGCTLSALAIAISRNAVFACIVGFGGAASIAVTALTKYEPSDPVIATIILFVISLIATLFAWLAVRNDWSLRR